MPGNEERNEVNGLIDTLAKDLIDNLKDPSALDSLLTDMRRRVGDQLTEITGLNTRAAAGLTSGTILTGLTGLWTARLGTQKVPVSTLEHSLFIAALVAYVVVVVFAVLAYLPRDFKTGPSPAKMVVKYVPEDETDPAVLIRQRTANKLVVDFDTNEDKIRWS